MKPRDLNLPPKFSRWMPNQKEAILAAATSDKRFVVINAPTGVGKTAIGMGISQLLGRTLYLTKTKPLQTQLMNDFVSMGLVELKGQNNYPCVYFDDGQHDPTKLPGCDDGPCHAGIECQYRDSGCNYYDAVRQAIKADLVVENYTHWMTLNRFSEPDVLGKFECVICDEAHEANDTLSDFVQVTLNRETARKLLHVELPFGASMEEWVEWAQEDGLPRVRARMEAAKATTAMFAQGISVVKALAELEGAITDLTKARSWKRTDAADPAVWYPGTSSDWIVEEEDDDITFQPVWASGYAEDYIFDWIPKVILLSATVTPRDAHYLGITKSQLDYLQYPSPFHRSKRPLYVVPTVAVRWNMSDGEERIWLRQIDRIVEREAADRKLKGIIHAVSYDRAMTILRNSRFRKIMIMHDRRNLRETVDRFRAMDGPAVLISPSVGTGYDFPGKDCRFQIIAKIPFIDPRPQINRARTKLDKEYPNHVALVALIQMAGRGVRSREDWCRTYLIDDSWNWFGRRTRKMQPNWFRAAIRKVDRLSDIRGWAA